MDVAGKKVEFNLQKSYIRNDRGGMEVTFSLEIETEKLTKAELTQFGKSLFQKLEGLNADDIGGGSPSPSNLTIEVLKQVL